VSRVREMVFSQDDPWYVFPSNNCTPPQFPGGMSRLGRAPLPRRHSFRVSPQPSPARLRFLLGGSKILIVRRILLLTNPPKFLAVFSNCEKIRRYSFSQPISRSTMFRSRYSITVELHGPCVAVLVRFRWNVRGSSSMTRL